MNWTGWWGNFHPKLILRQCTFTSTGGYMTPLPPIIAADLLSGITSSFMTMWIADRTALPQKIACNMGGAAPLFDMNASSNEKVKVPESYWRSKAVMKRKHHVVVLVASVNHLVWCNVTFSTTCVRMCLWASKTSVTKWKWFNFVGFNASNLLCITFNLYLVIVSFLE